MAYSLTRVPDLITLILAVGAAARITRLVVADTITDPLRTWALPRIARSRAERLRIAHGEPATPPTGLRGALVTLLTCHWCTGVWVAGALTPLALSAGGALWFILPASILTVSYAVGILGDQEGGQ